MKRLILPILLLIVGAVCALLFLEPTDAQINLLSGSLRYRIFNIPVSVGNLSTTDRSRIEGISPGPNEWVTVATFPLPTSNNSHAMCQGFYESAATWTTVDPQIAKAALVDVIQYIQTTHARYSLPDSIFLLQYASAGVVESGWQDDDLVNEYLKKRGIQYIKP